MRFTQKGTQIYYNDWIFFYKNLNHSKILDLKSRTEETWLFVIFILYNNSWCCTLYGFGQMYNDIWGSLWHWVVKRNHLPMWRHEFNPRRSRSHWRRAWPLQYSCLENQTDREAWLGGSCPWGHNGIMVSCTLPGKKSYTFLNLGKYCDKWVPRSYRV